MSVFAYLHSHIESCTWFYISHKSCNKSNNGTSPPHRTRRSNKHTRNFRISLLHFQLRTHLIRHSYTATTHTLIHAPISGPQACVHYTITLLNVVMSFGHMKCNHDAPFLFSINMCLRWQLYVLEHVPRTYNSLCALRKTSLLGNAFPVDTLFPSLSHSRQ